MKAIRPKRAAIYLTAVQEAELEEAIRNGYVKQRQNNQRVVDAYWRYCCANNRPYVRVSYDVSVDMWSTDFLELTEAAEAACVKVLMMMSKHRRLLVRGSAVISSDEVRRDLREEAARQLWEIVSAPHALVPERSRLADNVLGPNR